MAERFATQLAAAGCTLKINAASAVVGYWDEFRLEQVLANLLVNAMRHGAGKIIEIDVETLEGATRLAVRDSGAGIEHDDQSRIFQQFERSKNQRKGSGLGLGLFITDQIVRAHGGWVYVSSEPGSGATFSIRLPLRQASTEMT